MWETRGGGLAYLAEHQRLCFWDPATGEQRLVPMPGTFLAMAFDPCSTQVQPCPARHTRTSPLMLEDGVLLPLPQDQHTQHTMLLPASGLAWQEAMSGMMA